MSTAAPSFEHLFRLSDRIGLFEHARITEPRRELGYCVDDVARGLLVIVREPDLSPQLTDLAGIYFRFICDAQIADGRFHNRRGKAPLWTDDATVEDCWGRALWALGTVAARWPAMSAVALARFELGATLRSPWSRSMSFAAMGAAEVLRLDPRHPGARSLLRDSATLIGPVGTDPTWVWPEPRLRYANAVIPETLLAAGSLLDDPAATAAGLAMLGWLLDVETRDGHLSVTPVGGWTTAEARPGFDQQPIEVAALADACARALEITGEPRWIDALRHCDAWFEGDNDSAVALHDSATGGGCDGLGFDSRNENQGAESTLAVIATLQHTRSVNFGLEVRQ
ncbi:MAG: glycosyltransferase [Nakamurella sp.]